MTAPLRAPTSRGWCPGVRRPMETGDGLLVRVHPPGGVLTADQARLVAEVARVHGNGLLDVTGRGNVQIRGVRPGTYQALLARLDGAGLAGPETDGPPGLVLVSPLAGIDPGSRFDAAALAVAVKALADIPGLPQKLFVAIDDGGMMPVARPGADVIVTPDGARILPRAPGEGDHAQHGGGRALARRSRIRPPGAPNPKLFSPVRSLHQAPPGPPPPRTAGEDARSPVRPGSPPRLAIALASPDGQRPSGACSVERAPAILEAILRAFAAMRLGGRTGAGRIRDLEADLLRELADVAFGAGLGEGLTTRQGSSPRAGLIPLSETHTALLAALPFGRCTADGLSLAAEWSESLGWGEVRPSFTRGLLIPGVPAEEAPALAEEARAFGFIVDPDDPRLQVSACPGAPACASAASPAPADAALVAEAAQDLIAAGASLHVSGCPKGCARPGRADLTLVGAGDGCYGVVFGGAARDPAVARLPLKEIVQLLSAHPTPDALAQAVRNAPS